MAGQINHTADLTFDWLFLKNYFHPWLGLQEKNQSTFSRGMPIDSLALLLLLFTITVRTSTSEGYAQEEKTNELHLITSTGN